MSSTPYVRYGNHPSGQDDFDGLITDEMTYQEYNGSLYYNTGLIIEVPTNGIPPIGINRTPLTRADQPDFSDEDLALLDKINDELYARETARRDKRNARRRATYAARKAERERAQREQDPEHHHQQ